MCKAKITMYCFICPKSQKTYHLRWYGNLDFAECFLGTYLFTEYHISQRVPTKSIHLFSVFKVFSSWTGTLRNRKALGGFEL